MQTPTTDTGPTKGNGKKQKLGAGEGEGAMRIDVMRPSIPDLVALYHRKKDAATAYKDSVKAVATKGGVSKKALNAWVKAKAENELAEAHARIEQLSLLFEEM